MQWLRKNVETWSQATCDAVDIQTCCFLSANLNCSVDRGDWPQLFRSVFSDFRHCIGTNDSCNRHL